MCKKLISAKLGESPNDYCMFVALPFLKLQFLLIGAVLSSYGALSTS